MSPVPSDRSRPVHTTTPDTTKPTGEAMALDGVSARPGVTFARRGDLEDFLAQHGVARGAARRIAAGGWPALRKQSPLEAAFDEVRASLDSLSDLHPDPEN